MILRTQSGGEFRWAEGPSRRKETHRVKRGPHQDLPPAVKDPRPSVAEQSQISLLPASLPCQLLNGLKVSTTSSDSHGSTHRWNGLQTAYGGMGSGSADMTTAITVKAGKSAVGWLFGRYRALRHNGDSLVGSNRTWRWRLSRRRQTTPTIQVAMPLVLSLVCVVMATILELLPATITEGTSIECGSPALSSGGRVKAMWTFVHRRPQKGVDGERVRRHTHRARTTSGE